MELTKEILEAWIADLDGMIVETTSDANREWFMGKRDGYRNILQCFF